MAARKNSRRRGVILTATGYQKLQTARLERELTANFGVRYTNEELSNLTKLSLMTLAKIFTGAPDGIATTKPIPVDKQTIDLCFSAFNLTLDRADYLYPDESAPIVPVVEPAILSSHSDCRSTFDRGEAPDVSIFYGRAGELARLAQWINIDRCRLVAILGMGGIGKTTLVTKLAQQLQPEFTTIVWRSLRNAPVLTDLLPELIEIFSNKAEIVSPAIDLSAQITRLLECFRQQRCLLILDNAEAVIQNRDDERIDPGYAELFGRIGASPHQSCLLVTSREKPVAMIPLEGAQLAVRSLVLSGLTASDSDLLFDAKGLSRSLVGRARLLSLYSGNPLALNIVSTSICDLFDGDIDGFLDTDAGIFEDICQLLDQQFARLSPIETVVMYWLAIEREWLSPADLAGDIVPATTKQTVLTAFSSLGRRSLIEHNRGKFTQQAVVMEYVTAKFIDRVTAELSNWDMQQPPPTLPLWLSHPLVKSQSPTYIQAIQKRLILQPVASQLKLQFRQISALDGYMRSILASIRTCYPDIPHYGGGNLLNLLRHLQIELTSYNFAGLTMWQADMQGATLHDVNFSDADLSKSLFTNTFGWVWAIDFSPDSQLAATGETSGDIRLWQVGSGELLHKSSGHTSWVWAVRFSPDGRVLASASQDGTIRLWDVRANRLMRVLQASRPVLSLDFHPDGQLLATSDDAGAMSIWDIASGTIESTCAAHLQQVFSVRFSPDGRLIATGSDDNTVKIWDVATGDLCGRLTEHTRQVWTVRFSPVRGASPEENGQLLATGSSDGTIKLWDLTTVAIVATLPGYPDWMMSIDFSPDGRLLATGNSTNDVKIWEIDRIRANDAPPTAIATLHGHTSLVSLLKFSPDGKLLVTGGVDRSIRWWSTTTWQELSRWVGYTNRIQSAIFTPDGTQIVSSSQDGIVRVWDVRTGDLVRSLRGHDPGLILMVAYNPHSGSIASASEDRTVKIWDAATGDLVRTLAADRQAVWSVKFSPDGKLLASGCGEGRVRFWTETGELAATLLGHSRVVRSIVFSPEGQLMATASFDLSWRLWDVKTRELIHAQTDYSNLIWDLAFSPNGRFLAVGAGVANVAQLWDVPACQLVREFAGHTQDILAIEFSPDGRYLATGSADRTIKIWEVETGTVLQTLIGHLDRVNSLSYSPDGRIIVSGSDDETIKVWDLATGECQRAYTAPAPYLSMNISGVTGLSAAAIDSLKMLGAICAS
ncbi:WD40 repeat domain-containing protein [Chamaesiphon minutus]|uniref:WD40 repeat-containing protein n=1 Tax=Chamaesiphon minutus (strain ATCC 27169 / PCC 6605) TaxID=1173020 RepID=K9UQW2_CHAP6|nr:AAA family ATPase [Chamaesiphon minutus]AFY96639.1 WD40 repeat-containing protein [Chamaesiphon minutus PCC 6605]